MEHRIYNYFLVVAFLLMPDNVFACMNAMEYGKFTAPNPLLLNLAYTGMIAAVFALLPMNYVYIREILGSQNLLDKTFKRNCFLAGLFSLPLFWGFYSLSLKDTLIYSSYWNSQDSDVLAIPTFLKGFQSISRKPELIDTLHSVFAWEIFFTILLTLVFIGKKRRYGNACETSRIARYSVNLFLYSTIGLLCFAVGSVMKISLGF